MFPKPVSMAGIGLPAPPCMRFLPCQSHTTSSSHFSTGNYYKCTVLVHPSFSVALTVPSAARMDAVLLCRRILSCRTLAGGQHDILYKYTSDAM